MQDKRKKHEETHANLQKVKIDEIIIDDVASPMVTVEQTFNKIPVYLNGAIV